MKLSECAPGDLVVVDDEGAQCYVFVGNILWYGRSRKKIIGRHGTVKVDKKPSQVLVDDCDPERLCYVPFSWHSLSPDTEVIAVVETFGKRHEMAARTRASKMRRIGATFTMQDDSDVDPLTSPKPNGGW